MGRSLARRRWAGIRSRATPGHAAAAGISFRGSGCIDTEHDGACEMCFSARASEMRRRRSWNRPSAQEPGAAVRIPRLAWWTDHPSANAGPGCGDAECPWTARVGELTKQAPWQVRTRPSRALLRPVPGKRSRGHRAQPERPAPPPPNPSSGTAAARLSLLAPCEGSAPRDPRSVVATSVEARGLPRKWSKSPLTSSAE